jgi:hypothetical protein
MMMRVLQIKKKILKTNKINFNKKSSSTKLLNKSKSKKVIFNERDRDISKLDEYTTSILLTIRNFSDGGRLFNDVKIEENKPDDL